MKTLPEMLAAVAEQSAGRTAIVDGGTAVSYAILEKRITALAAKLYGMGVRKGDRVALLLSNGLDFVTGYFAIVRVGAIVVPLNDQYQQKELQCFLKECDVSLLITSQDLAQVSHRALSACESPCQVLLAGDQTGATDAELTALRDVTAGIDPDAPAMYQFSSGSTGRPKRIARTHTNLLFELNSLICTLHITHEDRFLGVAPFSHVNGLMRSMMASIRAGATLYPLPKFERQAVVDVIEKHKISIFIAVPFMFGMLAKANFRRPPALSSLRLCVSASASMPPKINREYYQRFGVYVRQLYGSTETGTISVNVHPDIEGTLESVGTPIAGVEVEVFTENGRLAEVGEMGEFAVKSPAAIKAYDGPEEGNEGVFREGYVFTGDLGRRDENGLLYLIGRRSCFINKGGYKINPREIEELLESHPGVEEAAVTGVPTSYGDEKVKAVIVLKDPYTEKEIVEFCQGKIANFKIPSLIEFRDSLPKSPTGKILRKVLT
jgi:long-chain acyl-CoA synthetase